MYYEEEWIDGVYCYRTSPDGEWIPLKPQPNAPIPPAMTDHAQMAEQLLEQMGNYPGVEEHFRDEWRAYYKQDIELLVTALADAERAGMERAAKMAEEVSAECLFQPDLDTSRIVERLAAAIRAKAQG